MSSTYRIAPKEVYYLDQLIGRALLDDVFCKKLLCGDIAILLDRNILSEETQAWLSTIRVTSLEEFAAVIVKYSMET